MPWVSEISFEAVSERQLSMEACQNWVGARHTWILLIPSIKSLTVADPSSAGVVSAVET